MKIKLALLLSAAIVVGATPSAEARPSAKGWTLATVTAVSAVRMLPPGVRIYALVVLPSPCYNTKIAPPGVIITPRYSVLQQQWQAICIQPLTPCIVTGVFKFANSPQWVFVRGRNKTFRVPTNGRPLVGKPCPVDP
jgi:hypothetical protein